MRQKLSIDFPIVFDYAQSDCTSSTYETAFLRRHDCRFACRLDASASKKDIVLDETMTRELQSLGSRNFRQNGMVDFFLANAFRRNDSYPCG